MRIINLFNRESQDIEAPLQAAASSDDPIEALKAGKLLDLVRYLTTQGPEPKAWGHFLVRELWLKPYNAANRILVRVWVDWFDYAPLKDGLPEAHYRFQIQRGQQVVSRDARAFSLAEAEHVIRDAFGW